MASGNTATVIGLGSMGWGAALSLLRAGFHVKGVDIRDEVLKRFTAEGGEAFPRLPMRAKAMSSLSSWSIPIRPGKFFWSERCGADCGARHGVSPVRNDGAECHGRDRRQT